MRLATFGVMALLCTPGCLAPWDTEPCPQEYTAKGCERRITEEAAIAIAKRDGLGAGIRPWETDFVHHADGGFRWSVRNFTHYSNPGGPGEGLYSASGDSFSIDAASGRIMEKSHWHDIE